MSYTGTSIFGRLWIAKCTRWALGLAGLLESDSSLTYWLTLDKCLYIYTLISLSLERGEKHSPLEGIYNDQMIKLSIVHGAVEMGPVTVSQPQSDCELGADNKHNSLHAQGKPDLFCL